MRTELLRNLAAAVAVVVCLASQPGSARAEERILWLKNDSVVTNAASIQTAIDFAVANNYNAVCTPARWRGGLYYKQRRDLKTFPIVGEYGYSGSVGDSLQAVIDRAHEAGLRVYAYFDCFLVSSNSDLIPPSVSPDWITHVYKDVASPVASNDTTYNPDPGYPRKMTAADGKGGVWVDPGIAAARTHVLNMLQDMVENYNVDGVILDQARYPGDAFPKRSMSFGYNPTALSEMSAGATPAPGNSTFVTKRRTVITNFLSTANSSVRAIKPWVIVGAGLFTDGSTTYYTDTGAFQYVIGWGVAPNAGHVGGLGVVDFVAPLLVNANTSINLQQMQYFKTDIGGDGRMLQVAAMDTAIGAAAVAQNMCDTRGISLAGLGWHTYSGTGAATFMSTVNATNTSPCGTGVMSSASPLAEFTLRNNWDSVKPMAPTTLNARATPAGHVILTWGASGIASDGDRPSRHRIYRSTVSPVKAYYENLLNRAQEVTGNSFVDDLGYLPQAVTYHYMVEFLDDHNNGVFKTVSVTVPASTGMVFAESRTASGALTSSPTYSEEQPFSSDPAKSTAPGLVGMGTRYTTTKGISAAFMPTITQSGFYDVYLTCPGEGPPNDAWTDYTIKRDASSDLLGSVAISPAAMGNTWKRVREAVKLLPGTAGGISLLNDTDDDTNTKRMCMDAAMFRRASGSTARWVNDTFDTGEVKAPGATTGWSLFGMDNAVAHADHSGGAYRAHVVAQSGKLRVTGVIANASEHMPYAAVGSENYVRAKFHVYCGGQSTPGQANLIPNMRMRVANRFAVTSMLEVYTHVNGDPEQNLLSQDFRPSSDPAKPSVYRVDFDPVDVPMLTLNPLTEGIQRAFEAISTDPQDHGFVAMTESSLSVYPAAEIAGGTPAKVYATTASDAGDLKQVSPGDVALYRYIPGATSTDLGTADFTGTVPTHTENSLGVTLDTTALAPGSLGIAVRNFNPDRGTDNFAARVRISPSRLYRVRFHLMSWQNVNAQPQIRLRARTAKFGWSQKLELGGAWGTDVGKTYPLNQNNAIAQQALPGIGTQNPDRVGEEGGGWYTVLMHSPLDPDIRADAATGTPLATSMPNLSAQPPFGVALASRRDVLFGFDVIDSISSGLGAPLEQGNVTLDRIEVYHYSPVPD